MKAEQISEGLRKLQEGMSMLSSGPFTYTMDCLLRSQELLLTKYAPFKVGDRVELAVTPEISNTVRYGWLHSKHFLIEGAQATVVETHIDRNDLSIAVHFDDESWIDFRGERHAATQPHQYVFRCEDLRPAGAAKLLACIADVIGGAG